MTPRLLSLALLLTSGLGAATPTLAAVESGHWSLLHNDTANAWGSNLSILVDQTPAGDYTGTFFLHDATARTLQFVTRNIDEGSTVFLATPGQTITAETFASLNATQTLNTPVVVGTEFYLGVGTVSMSDPGFSWSNIQYQSFGWAHVRAGADGQLSIVDSAMAFREPGIVVGTLNTPAVPEPSTWALMGLGLVGMGWAARRRNT